MRLACAALACVMVGCYSPSFREGLPCTDAGGCPEGQTCGDDGVCRAQPVGFDGSFVCEVTAAEPALLEAPAAQAGDSTGLSLAMSGDWLALGAPAADIAATNAGAVHLFERTAAGWTFHSTITASDATAEARFGFALAYDDPYLVVGAPDAGAGPQLGAAYVFERIDQTFTEQTILADAGGADGDEFGHAVATFAGRVAVGAPLGGGGAGEVHTFAFDAAGPTWTPAGTFAAGDAAGDFASVLAMNDQLIVIGAPGDDDNGTRSGSVFILQRNDDTWVADGKIVPADGAAGDEFGKAIALEADRMLIGAPLRGGGVAYLFDDNRTVVDEYTADDADAGDGLGGAVATSADILALGAATDDDLGTSSGSLYLFGRGGSGYRQSVKLVAPAGAEFDLFGAQVAIDATDLVVAAPLADGDAANTGAAIAYRVSCD